MPPMKKKNVIEREVQHCNPLVVGGQQPRLDAVSCLLDSCRAPGIVVTLAILIAPVASWVAGWQRRQLPAPLSWLLLVLSDFTYATSAFS